MKFRKDINGLRAIAVISVVLFHFNPDWVPGGFAGVDVFFVISGFLMTSIILSGLESQSFNLAKFYIARANRIIPALAMLSAVLLAFGFILLTNIDYAVLGKHVASSMLFISNIGYWFEAGYFDSRSHEKWLLHTWSLSVEWQFYILYPIVLKILASFLSINNLKKLLLISTIVLFALSAYATYKSPQASYFLLPTRAWEMMVGGIAFCYPVALSARVGKVTELLGILMIVVAYVYITPDDYWPGYLAALPVGGAFLVILASRESSIFTSNFLFQYLGKWSYSIYLWHWPLVVLIYWYSLDSLYIYLGILLSIVLGFLSYKYIEAYRFKGDFRSFMSLINCKPILFSIVISLIGYGVYTSEGLDVRFSPETRLKYKEAFEAHKDEEYPEPNLVIGGNLIRFIEGTSDENILFIGASHIAQTYPYAKINHGKYNVYYLTEHGCFLTPSFKKGVQDCSNIQNYKALFQNINFSKVVTSFYLFRAAIPEDEVQAEAVVANRIKEYDEFLKFAKQHTDELYLVLGEPTGDEFDPKLSIRHGLSLFVTKQAMVESHEVSYKALEKLKELQDVVIIDPLEFFCTDICPTIGENGKYIYYDKTHYRPWFAVEHLTFLEPVFK
ncbi:acyltransferase family protein [Gayadomonas joobiniege]|uniref:acyltransferase family protein n=1 Tax=Gayadomonas joobiniege TaxID=1234606 RepID=UPI000368661D|nr:acyltransferase family protein [Gayadomonas joobiniege]